MLRRSFPIVVAALMVVTLFACSRGTAAPSTTAAPTVRIADPTPAPSVAFVAPSGQTAFESTRYGYRLAYPYDWTVSETPGSGGLHPDEPGVDTFKDDVGHILSVVGEPALRLNGWTCAIALHLQGEHKLPVESSEDIVVAGEPARVLQYHLEIKPYVIHYLTVELVHQGRGLTLSMESTTNRDDEDRRILDAFLASFELV